jgi:hypothetical protein
MSYTECRDGTYCGEDHVCHDWPKLGEPCLPLRGVSGETLVAPCLDGVCDQKTGVCIVNDSVCTKQTDCGPGRVCLWPSSINVGMCVTCP